MTTIITDIVREQLEEKYTAVELVDILCLDVTDIIDNFEDLIEDKLEELLDKERGIGL